MSTAFSVAAPVSARPADNVRKEKLVSMLVACCGQLEYTRLCVPSLLRHSRQPLELLFLDTGSLDGTAEYLAGIADAVPFRVDIVPVSDGAGADLQKKQDVLQVSGPYVVLLNNDTILTEGWLDRLLAVAAANPALGLIAPMSNYAPPPMLVEQMPFRISPELGAREQLALLDRFAKEWA
jgi:GT2 family glycosyltransferase